MPKSGAQFTQAVTESMRLCGDASGELDFKMIENALSTCVNAASMVLPYADDWHQYNNQ